MTIPKNTPASSRRLACLVLLALAVACGEGETDLLNPGSVRDLGAVPDTLSDIFARADRSYRPRIDTGSLTAFTMADENGVQSAAYLQFDSAELPDTAGVLIGRLGLRMIRGSGGFVRIRAHEIAPEAPDWNEDEVPLEPLPLLDPFFEMDGTISPAEGETLIVTDVVRIPAAIIQRWKRDPASNRGMALTLDPSRPGILRALSKEATVDTVATAVNPQLEILRADATSVLLEPTDDAYRLVDANLPATGNEVGLRIEQGTPHEALLRFALPETLKAGDTVHRAEILLWMVPGSVAVGDSFIVGIYRNESGWEESAEPDTVSRERLAIDVAVVKSDVDSLLLDLGPVVQRWVDGEDNHGITLRILNEGLGVSAAEVFSREAAPDRQPRMSIVFSPAPDPRWSAGKENP